MSNNAPMTIANGDGIGPEMMEASLHIVRETGARTEGLRTFGGKPSYRLAQGQ